MHKLSLTAAVHAQCILLFRSQLFLLCVFHFVNGLAKVGQPNFVEWDVGVGVSATTNEIYGKGNCVKFSSENACIVW